MLAGRERPTEEYAALFARSGLRPRADHLISEMLPEAMSHHLIEAEPVQ